MRRLLIVLLVLFSSCVVMAEEIDIQKLAQDTQRFRYDKSNIDMIWWIPNEYWETAFKANPALTPETQKQFIGVVDKYMVFAVLEGKLGPLGSITGTPKEKLQEKITVLVQGQTLTPLPETELSDDARNLLRMMKPMLANMLGKIGQGMEFIVFKGKNAKGERYANPKQEGFLALNIADKEFKWRLPLGCFLPPKYDPETGEDFPGNYTYSPFTGTRLVTSNPNKTAGGDVK